MTPPGLFDTHQDQFIAIRTFEGGFAKYGHSNTSAEEAISNTRMMGFTPGYSTLVVWERTDDTQVHDDMKFQVYRRM